jgi:hypothetical protein
MRLIIFLVLFFQSIVFQGQVIKFVDLDNLPVSDVYIELLNNERNQKIYISNQDGVIDLLNFTNANLVYRLEFLILVILVLKHLSH